MPSGGLFPELMSGNYRGNGRDEGLLFGYVLISYMLKYKEHVQLFKEESSVNNIQVLEEKITKVIDKIKSLTEENKVLKEDVSGLKDQLVQKDEELKTVKNDLGAADALRSEIEKLNSERDTVRSQIENLLRELESVEL